MFRDFGESKISPRVEEMKKDKRIRVIIRKAEDIPIPDLVEKVRKLTGVSISGFTDFFIFAQISEEVEIQQIETYPEVDRVFLDEPITAFLNYSVGTTKASATWNTFRRYGEGITWAVVDSGINDLHPFFVGQDKSKKRGGPPNWWSEELTQRVWFRHLHSEDRPPPHIENGYPGNTVLMRFHFVKERKLHQHGTHVAGIIAGNKWEGDQEVENPPGERVQKLQPLAPEAKLLDFRVLDDEGKGDTSDAINALFMIRKINEEAGRVVIAGANLSLGYQFNPMECGCGASPLCEEVDRLVHSGVLVVVAAGNFGTARFTTTLGFSSSDLKAEQQRLYNFQSIADPGNAREAITVGSTHRKSPHRWGVSAFSSRGPTGDGREKPDLLAPGEKIVSCNSNFDPKREQRLFLRLDGTSQAAAQVSGALALFLSIHSEFIGRPFEVKEKLLASCTDLGRERYHQGRGLLDIFRLAQSV
jgi:subtilisin family serine protease